MEQVGEQRGLRGVGDVEIDPQRVIARLGERGSKRLDGQVGLGLSGGSPQRAAGPGCRVCGSECGRGRQGFVSGWGFRTATSPVAMRGRAF
jgi:hypothetical protein